MRGTFKAWMLRAKQTLLLCSPWVLKFVAHFFFWSPFKKASWLMWTHIITIFPQKNCQVPQVWPRPLQSCLSAQCPIQLIQVFPFHGFLKVFFFSYSGNFPSRIKSTDFFLSAVFCLKVKEQLASCYWKLLRWAQTTWGPPNQILSFI